MKISIMFVCLGNICRSPALEATLKHLSIQYNVPDLLKVDSSGIGWDHIGQHPDQRSFDAARKRGILIDHIAQQFRPVFFNQYDYLFCVDFDILEQVKCRAETPAHKAKVFLATAYSSKYRNQEIPDPYYFEKDGFDQVMNIIVDSCEGILKECLRVSGRL